MRNDHAVVEELDKLVLWMVATMERAWYDAK